MHPFNMRKLIHVSRFKSRLSGNGLGLRRYRMGDAKRLQRLFGSEAFPCAQCGGQPPSGSLLFFWLWLHRTFQWVYCIIDQKDGNAHTIGFIGLYGMESAQCVKLAMAIFKPAERRRGSGRQAIELLLGDWRERSVVKEVSVDVPRENIPSMTFFQKLGFKPVAAGETIWRLRRTLAAGP